MQTKTSNHSFEAVMSKVRDCSVCLEPLVFGDFATTLAPTVPLTFCLPCGHVFHTSCFHAWNKAQCKRHLQCASCQGLIVKSYYLCDNLPCENCDCQMYQKEIVFDSNTKMMHHADCHKGQVVYPVYLAADPTPSSPAPALEPCKSD